MGKRKFIGLYVDAELHQKIEMARNFEPRSSFLGRLIAAALQEEDQCKDCGVPGFAPRAGVESESAPESG